LYFAYGGVAGILNLFDHTEGGRVLQSVLYQGVLKEWGKEA